MPRADRYATVIDQAAAAHSQTRSRARARNHNWMMRSRHFGPLNGRPLLGLLLDYADQTTTTTPKSDVYVLNFYLLIVACAPPTTTTTTTTKSCRRHCFLFAHSGNQRRPASPVSTTSACARAEVAARDRHHRQPRSWLRRSVGCAAVCV